MPSYESHLPAVRGELSDLVVHALRRAPGPIALPAIGQVDALADDDLQLALWCCYALHYRSFAGVHDGWEWEPALLGVRRVLEDALLAGLTDEVGAPPGAAGHEVLPAIDAFVAADDGPSLSAFLEQRGTYEQMREFLVHRSAYQLKEADPHTWALPRLTGATKAAFAAIQHDEYGEGRAEAMHAELFARTMRAFDLDTTYGAYIDLLPGVTLATDNLVSLFGLHRRWRAACVGHLAVFEMTSVTPMGRYSRVLRRLRFGEGARRFYDAHVLADTVHERVARDEMVGALVTAEPERAGDVLFGARCVSLVERRFSEHLLDSWTDGRSSLLRSLPSRPVAV
jgi:hypothetical protein